MKVNTISFRDDFCRVFDLTSRIPAEVVDAATTSKQLTTVDPSQERSVQHVLGRIAQKLGPEEELTSRKPLRICIPSLGSPAWGDLEPQVSSITSRASGPQLMPHRIYATSSIPCTPSYDATHMLVHLYHCRLIFVTRHTVAPAGYES